MAGVGDMIAQAERSLANNTHGTPNEITRFYAERNGKGFLNELWCDMSITFWAFRSGNHTAVCFGTDFALTSAHVERFRKAGQFHDGADGIHLGDIVFFPREGHAIGHVGVVTKVKDGIVHTIEGNTSDAVRRRTHPMASVVGYGRPRYEATMAEEDDFMPLFKNMKEFNDAVRAVVRDEVEKVVRDELAATYHLLAHGGEQVPSDPGDTHLQESHLGLRRHVEETVADSYRMLARGEVNGVVDPTGTHFKDSNRHLAQLLQAIADATNAHLPEPSPRP